MTDKEKAIVMAYTGIAMLVGDKFDIFHRYIEEKMGRPIWTHELASKKVWAEIKEATKEDFTRLCRETSSEAIPIEWIEHHIKELDTELQSLYSRFCSQEGKERTETMLRYMELCLTPKAYETVLSEWRKENGSN